MGKMNWEPNSLILWFDRELLESILSIMSVRCGWFDGFVRIYEIVGKFREFDYYDEL
ncbi:hypothetical protein Sjap_006587 [Stephania japonica]|uniref:Uncharacterized protein n=1 Tax=Stephania japonica TaxID=461633 RepID=A0AAP0K7P7_9MAGN